MSMTIPETGELLKIAQRFDRRTIGEGDIEAWFAALYGLEYDACAAAVIYHYGRETDFIMPAHVRHLATPPPSEAAYQLPANPTKNPNLWRDRSDQGVVLWADKSKTNKELVGKYKDIAARLAEPPYKGTPEGWSGFIPSAPGPVRDQLLALVHEAAERADQQQSAEATGTSPAGSLPTIPQPRS